MRIKLLFLTICAFITIANLEAQNNTSSPYTRYGLGLLESNTFGRGQSMGGSGIALRSNKTINPSNPASFSAIDTLSQIFEFGFSGRFSMFEAGNDVQYNNDLNFEFIGLAFPLSKNIGFSVGVKPLSNVGYDYIIENDLENIGMTRSEYTGIGGVSELFTGISFKLLNRLSLGANLSYLFGSTSHNRIVEFTESLDFSNFYSNEKISVSAIHPTFGFQYIQPISENNNIIIGGKYELKTSLNAEQDFSYVKELSGITPINIASALNRPVEIEVPEVYGFGLTYERKNKLTVTGEYEHEKWSESKFFNVTDSLGDRTRFSAGVEYIPNYIDRSYFNRVEYRLGGFYSTNYITGLGEDLFNFGMTFGLGLPLRYEKTRFNIAFELGQMKSSKGSLIDETYGKITINFSFNDYWFFRRKIE